MSTDITAPSELTHPYSVRFTMLLGSNVELDLAEDEVRVPFGKDQILIIKKLKELANNVRTISLDVEAFSTACEAERAGTLMAFSLMWLAASKRITIGLG